MYSESLNKILNRKRDISYEYFKNDLINFIKKLMKNINKDDLFFNPIVEITNNCKDKGSVEGLKLSINEKIIKLIYLGNRLALLTVFHELCHFNHNCLIKSLKIDERLSNIIKDDLIDTYFDFESEDKNIKNLKYYDLNYNVDSGEVQADIESIDMFIDYFDKNNIKLNLIELIYLHDLTNDCKKRLKNKKRKYKIGKYSLYKKTDLNKLFDMLIVNNPIWLEWYPQLELEYYIDKKIVKKIDKIG